MGPGPMSELLMGCTADGRELYADTFGCMEEHCRVRLEYLGFSVLNREHLQTLHVLHADTLGCMEEHRRARFGVFGV